MTPTDDTGNPGVLLRIPPALSTKLATDAKGRSIQAVILEILADHYGVEIPVPARGRPKNQSD